MPLHATPFFRVFVDENKQPFAEAGGHYEDLMKSLGVPQRNPLRLVTRRNSDRTYWMRDIHGNVNAHRGGDPRGCLQHHVPDA